MQTTIEQVIGLASGTIATLMSKAGKPVKTYDEIDAIQERLLKHAIRFEKYRAFNTWVDAWNDFSRNDLFKGQPITDRDGFDRDYLIRHASDFYVVIDDECMMPITKQQAIEIAARSSKDTQFGLFGAYKPSLLIERKPNV